jgi:hypothetical protein
MRTVFIVVFQLPVHVHLGYDLPNLGRRFPFSSLITSVTSCCFKSLSSCTISSSRLLNITGLPDLIPCISEALTYSEPAAHPCFGMIPTVPSSSRKSVQKRMVTNIPFSCFAISITSQFHNLSIPNGNESF